MFLKQRLVGNAKVYEWFSYGDTKLAQGREGVKQLLNDNEELKEELKEKVFEAMKNGNSNEN